MYHVPSLSLAFDFLYALDVSVVQLDTCSAHLSGQAYVYVCTYTCVCRCTCASVNVYE